MFPPSLPIALLIPSRSTSLLSLTSSIVMSCKNTEAVEELKCTKQITALRTAMEKGNGTLDRKQFHTMTVLMHSEYHRSSGIRKRNR